MSQYCIYSDEVILVTPTFEYEVALYKITNSGANQLYSQYYTSNKLLKVESSLVVKKGNNFILVRYITLTGMPLAYIKQLNLRIFNDEKRKN